MLSPKYVLVCLWTAENKTNKIMGLALWYQSNSFPASSLWWVFSIMYWFTQCRVVMHGYVRVNNYMFFSPPFKKQNVVICRVHSLVSICSSAFSIIDLSLLFLVLLCSFCAHTAPYFSLGSHWLSFATSLSHACFSSHVLTSLMHASTLHVLKQGHVGHFVCPLATLKPLPHPSKDNHTSSVCW